MSVLKKISDAMSGKAPLSASRSPQWPKVRADFLKKNGKCALCEGTASLEVHHIKPFHTHPELELDPANLITLCEAAKNGIVCHQAFGHLGDYKSVNPTVKTDVKTWNKKLKNRKDAK